MNGEVNKFWVRSILNLFQSEGVCLEELTRVVGGSGLNNDRALTEAQCTQFFYLCEKRVSGFDLVVNSMKFSNITDYYLLGMLMGSCPKAYDLLVDKEFLRRYIYQTIEVKRVESLTGVVFKYLLPSSADHSMNYIVLHFLCYMSKIIFDNDSEFEVCKIYFGEQCYSVSDNKLIQSIGDIKKINSDIEFHLARSKKTIEFDGKRIIYNKLKSIIDRDDRYVLGNELIDRVIRLAYQNIGNPDFNHIWVARRLGMSERKLQKHLKEKGTSYRELLDEVRKDLSEKYLIEDKFSVTQTAFKLGYTATSNFIRAHKRWRGCSPMARAC